MKRNPNYLLREVAGSHIVVPVGAATADFPGMITLNKSGCFLWELLANDQTCETLVDALRARYEVSRDQARADVELFVENMKIAGAIID